MSRQHFKNLGKILCEDGLSKALMYDAKVSADRFKEANRFVLQQAKESQDYFLQSYKDSVERHDVAGGLFSVYMAGAVPGLMVTFTYPHYLLYGYMQQNSSSESKVPKRRFEIHA